MDQQLIILETCEFFEAMDDSPGTSNSADDVIDSPPQPMELAVRLDEPKDNTVCISLSHHSYLWLTFCVGKVYSKLSMRISR